MMNRRTFSQGAFAATAGTLTLLLTHAPAAFADDWCSADPLVKVVTPQGTKQNVHVTIFALGVQHRRAVHKATVTWSAAAASGGTSTDVTVTVTVPLDGSTSAFTTKALVSTRPNGMGTVLAHVEGGEAGTPMGLTYTLAMP